MKKYIGEVSYCLKPKNRLQKFIQEWIKINYDGKIIHASKIEQTKAAIIKRIAGINLDHAKCTPEKVYWWTPANDFNSASKNWVLGGCDCIRFSFICSKEK